jgi:hypothetical protein
MCWTSIHCFLLCVPALIPWQRSWPLVRPRVPTHSQTAPCVCGGTPGVCHSKGGLAIGSPEPCSRAPEPAMHPNPCSTPQHLPAVAPFCCNACCWCAAASTWSPTVSNPACRDWQVMTSSRVNRLREPTHLPAAYIARHTPFLLRRCAGAAANHSCQGHPAPDTDTPLSLTLAAVHRQGMAIPALAPDHFHQLLPTSYTLHHLLCIRGVGVDSAGR